LIGTGTTGGGTTGGGTTGGGTTGGAAPGGAAPGGAAPGGAAPGGAAPGGTAPGGAAPAPVRPIDALAARLAQAEAAGNDRLANRIEDFIAANPNAGIKKIEKEFPQIAAAIKAAPAPVAPTPDPVSQAQAQAAQAVLNILAPVQPDAPQPLIQLNPLSAQEIAALIAEAQYAPGYGGGGPGPGGIRGFESVMY